MLKNVQTIMEPRQRPGDDTDLNTSSSPEIPAQPAHERLRDYRIHMRRIDPRIHSKPPTYHISHVAYRPLKPNLRFECNVTCVKCTGVSTIEISVNKEDEYKEPQIKPVEEK